jgi:hypothetical protein
MILKIIKLKLIFEKKLKYSNGYDRLISKNIKEVSSSTIFNSRHFTRSAYFCFIL